MSHTATVKSVPIKSIKALRRAVEELKQKGVHCELLENAIPRMYYRNQITNHLKNNKNYILNGDLDVCDYILRLPSCFYDIGFVKKADGSYEPVFDNFHYPSAHSISEIRGFKPISSELGVALQNAKAQGYSNIGAVEAAEATMASIGKFLQTYSKHAAIEAAEDAGYNVLSTEMDEFGNVQIEVEVV